MKTLKKTDIQLDDIDRKIIHMLMDNAKSSLAQISNKIGISTTAVHQRIKKLEIAKVIESAVSLLNPKSIGYKVISYVSLFLEKPSQYATVINVLKNINEVVEAHYTTARYTIFLKLICIDNDDLLRILNNIDTIEGVSFTESFISLEQSIYRQLKV